MSTATRGRRERLEDPVGLSGTLRISLRGPDGRYKAHRHVKNLITQRGDQYFMERAVGIASPPGQVTGAKLGTSTTAAAKTGAGAALVAYLAGSQRAVDVGFPTSGLNGAARRITWRFTWPANAATHAAITEVALVIDALADATSTDVNTIARAVFAAVSKGAQDSLEVTWTQDGQGT